MPRLKLGNGRTLSTYLAGKQYQRACECDFWGMAALLNAMEMGAGSNLRNLYHGRLCKHNNPIDDMIIQQLERDCEEPIKVKGQAYIMGWLGDLLKGSVALVYFTHGGLDGYNSGYFDLYLVNKLWIDPDRARNALEMWIWPFEGGQPIKHHHRHHKSHKSHNSNVHIF